MSFDIPGRGREDRSRAPGRRAAAGVAATITFVLIATCSPAADSPDEAAEAPPPRITAEHPVTARPALQAGLLDGGATDGGPVLGEAGSVDGPEAGAGGAALAAVLPADEVAGSVDFYTGLLGFDITSSEPAEPPFRRAELIRGDIRIVLLGPEEWEREMANFGEPEVEEAGGDEGSTAAGEADQEAAETGGGAGAQGGRGRGAGPVLRLALEDLNAVAVGLAEAGVEVGVRDGEAGGAEVPGGRRLAVVDPAGVRLLLVPVEGS